MGSMGSEWRANADDDSPSCLIDSCCVGGGSESFSESGSHGEEVDISTSFSILGAKSGVAVYGFLLQCFAKTSKVWYSPFDFYGRKTKGFWIFGASIGRSLNYCKWHVPTGLTQLGWFFERHDFVSLERMRYVIYMEMNCCSSTSSSNLQAYLTGVQIVQHFGYQEGPEILDPSGVELTLHLHTQSRSTLLLKSYHFCSPIFAAFRANSPISSVSPPPFLSIPSAYSPPVF
ncbi:hypothetical protein H6P81_002730 [Aristolochia fimbriata]|uniref:Uncharacterized protein n=1 Tax=Aristolochia fimbriata TaxID=158543 RepID=A0AAV7FEP5_ARIFI|nr:hypothetical protein H6P81_002730 [Aristolochia fimbriata]